MQDDVVYVVDAYYQPQDNTPSAPVYDQTQHYGTPWDSNAYYYTTPDTVKRPLVPNRKVATCCGCSLL